MTLLVVVDPPAVIPVFLAMTQDQSEAQRKRTAWRAAFTAFLVLSAFATVGGLVFAWLGISMAAFRVAGGILLLLLSIDMLRAQPSRQTTTPEEQREGIEKDDVSIFPLAIPMLAGPGATSTVMVLVSRSSSPLEFALVGLAVAIVCFFCGAALSGASLLASRLGRTGLNVIQRVMGLILAAAAVEFVLDGLLEYARKTGKIG
jgi:multiple antibiotic resistance protein